jgi:hypothetical protein
VSRMRRAPEGSARGQRRRWAGLRRTTTSTKSCGRRSTGREGYTTG